MQYPVVPREIHEDARILNNHLTGLKSAVEKQYYLLESLGKEITADAIKNAILGTIRKEDIS
jgi:hypothetical protein